MRLGEPAPLLGLRRRMIELEDAQVLGPLEPIGEGVETRAQHQDLPHAFFDRTARRVLGEAAAHGDEQAQAPPLRPFPGERDGVVGVWPEDRKRERVGEDEAPLEDLMRRPVSRRAKRGHARLSVLHGTKLEEPKTACRARRSLTPKTRSPIDPSSISPAIRQAGRFLIGAARFHICRNELKLFRLKDHLRCHAAAS